MAKSFNSRVYDNIAENIHEYYEKVDYGFRNKNDKGSRRCFRGSYAVAAYKIKKYEEVLYTEWDLRGLTAVEKEYIRDNGMKNYVDIRDFSFSGKTERVYLIIQRNSVGRKVLYGFMKKQWIDLNAQHFNIFNSSFNYDKMLTFQNVHHRAPFTKFQYEVTGRPTDIMGLF